MRTTCFVHLLILLSFLVPTKLPGQVSVSQLDNMASRMLTANNLNMRGIIKIDRYRSGGVASAAGSACNGVIFVSPEAMYSYSVNSWAFILGHELAHIALGHTRWGSRGMVDEFRADIFGARMAVNAGWDIYDYLADMQSQPNICTPSHGCVSQRVANLKREFGIYTYAYRR